LARAGGRGQAQIERLQNRDASHHQPEQLFGRDSVLHTPPQLARSGVTVISGHHGRVLLKHFRIIVDTCSGDERNALGALVLPDMLLVYSDGKVEPRDASVVFPGRARKKAPCVVGDPGTPKSATGSWPPSPNASEPPTPLTPNSFRGFLKEQSWQHPDPRQQGWSFSMPQGDSSPLEE